MLATQCLAQRKPKTMKIDVRGRLAEGVMAKDLALGIIGQIGTDGATGHVIEYAGPAVRALSMEGRMTLCNMSIEAGARAGMVAPDETTINYVKGRRFAPTGADWDKAVAYWRSLPSDEGAVFDKVMSNVEEIKARGGPVIAITCEGGSRVADIADDVIQIPWVEEYLQPIVNAIPLQLLAYHIAVRRGCDVDQPRNLAKSVTVE